MPFLDTDILISFLRGHPKAIEFITKLNKQKEILMITSINSAELYIGVLNNSLRKHENLKSLEKFLHKFTIHEFTHQDAKCYGEIQANLHHLGTPIGKMDTLIGAVVLNRDEVLITHNIKHFEKIPLLKIQDWKV